MTETYIEMEYSRPFIDHPKPDSRPFDSVGVTSMKIGDLTAAMKRGVTLNLNGTEITLPLANLGEDEVFVTNDLTSFEIKIGYRDSETGAHRIVRALTADELFRGRTRV